MKNKYWTSPVGGFDDFGNQITDIIIDGKTNKGPWATMSEESWKHFGGTGGKFGIGLGQKYQKQSDGKWLMIEGGDE